MTSTKTRVLSFPYTTEGKNLLEVFSLTRETEAHWKKVLDEFRTSPETDVAKFFMEKLDANEFSDSELIFFAIAGFKSPLDDAKRDVRLVAKMLRGMMRDNDDDNDNDDGDQD